jgi:two-component system osmolarity sensor histidine kinase EnvZ
MGRPVVVEERQAGLSRPAPFVGKLSLLRRAVSNLIDNAVAHGSQVKVALVALPGKLEVVVEDDGPGIATEDLTRAMDPYVRLDSARGLDSGGVGLGLAIARDACAYHGGRLVLTNRETGGLRAVLELPLGTR